MDNTAMTDNSKRTSTGELYTNQRADSVAFAYLGIIVFTYRIFTGFMKNFPEIAASGAVINAVVSSVLMLIIVKVTMLCLRYVGNINLLKLCKEYLGSFGHGLVGLVVILFAVISISNAVIEFSELSRVIAFKTAPLWFIIIFFALIIFMSQRVKINSVLGTASVITPIILILLVLLIATSFKYGDINNLFPILGNGVDSLVLSGIKTVSIYSDFLLLLFAGSVFGEREVKKATKAIEISAVIGAVINVALVLIFTLCAAYPFSKDISNPLYHIVEIVYYGRFFQRIDGFYMLIALLSGILYISYASNVLIETTKDLLKLKNTKALSVMYPIIIAVLSCAFGEKSVNDKLNSYILNYSFIIGLILPLVLAILIMLINSSKRKKKEQKTKK